MATSVKQQKLTVKQAKFVKAKIAGKSGVEAAKEAYSLTDYNTAAVIASQNLNKLNINQAIQAEMTRQGITLELLVQPLKDALTADKVSIVGNGDQAMAEVTPDHAIRLKAVTIASQFMGVNKNNDGGNTNYNFINVSREDKGDYGL